MINLSFETHLPLVEMDPGSMDPVVKWRDRTTGACGRIDYLVEWSYDGELPTAMRYLFEDTFGISVEEYQEIAKKALADPDKARVTALALAYDEKRYHPVTLREAKEAVKALVKDHPSFRGIGLRANSIVVMWADEADQPVRDYQGWVVETAITGDAEAF